MSSHYYAPLMNNEDVYGVFTIQSQHKGVFKDFNLSILTTLHNYLNISIKNILSFEALQVSIEQNKATQSKLVQNEKMASIGQLTAGIAHEIKNPLNFVINFSELTSGLVQDIKEQIEEYKSDTNINREKTLTDIDEIIESMQLNVNKISEHSRRADKVVKGMLQLSRGKSGEFIPTNINDLVSEYTKLAYHGLRATDPQFNVDIHYELDEKIDKVNIVPHNISRVIINIVANACAAAYDKHKNLPDSKPEVKVSTIDYEDRLVIII
jgi:signal transduction histidine kinase